MNKQNSKPIITILMPVYNGSQYLEETLNSILDQSFLYFELICIDDTSTDNSYQILQNFAAKDSRIRLLQKPNGGTVPKALNYALDYVQGEYLYYTSQDDLMSNDLLEKMYICAKQTEADGVIPNMIWYYSDGDNSRGIFVEKGKLFSSREAASLSIDFTIHGFILWKSSHIKNIKYHDFALFSDEYSFRVFLMNSKTLACSDGFFYYRQNNPNAITKKIKLSLFDKLEVNHWILNLFKQNSITLEEHKKIMRIHFNDLFGFQTIAIQAKGIMAKKDLKIAQRKIKTAYKKFGDNEIKLLDLSPKRRLMFTNGYYLFVLGVRLLLLKQSLNK